jgi:pheromone shutdown protein TraB
MAIIVTVRALLLKKKEDNTKEAKADKEEKSVQRKTWLLATITLAIIGIVVFLLTENTKLPMTLLDKWTRVNAVIFTLEIIAIIFTFKRKKYK